MNALLSAGPQLFNWIWQTSVQAAFLAVLVLGLQKLLGRRLPHKVRYALGLLIVCRLLLPVAPASPLSLENLLWGTARSAEAPGLPSTLAGPDHLLHAGGSEQALSPVNPGPSLSWGSVLGGGWACGCLVLVGAAGWRYGKWKRLVRSGKRISDSRLLSILDQAREAMGVRRSVALVAAPEANSPAVFGVWRVCLLLPEATLLHLDERELRLVFMHEMAHVRRNDGLLDVILMGLQFLHWFNPLVWFAFHRLRAERELVCDAMVIGQTGDAERCHYGQVLIKLADSLCAEDGAIPAVIPVIGRKRDIKRRILAIKQGQRTSGFSLLAAGVSAGAVVCLTFTGATQPAAPTPAATVRLYRNDQFVGEQKVALAGGKILFSFPPALAHTQSHSAPLNRPPAAHSVTATNGVVLKQGDAVLTARELSFDPDEGSLVARGDVNVRQSKRGWDPSESSYQLSATNGVTLKNDGIVIAGKQMLYDSQTGRIVVRGPFEFRRDGLVVNGDQLTYNVQTKETASEPIVSEVGIKFIGPQSVGEDAIRTNIHVKAGSLFDLEAVDSDVRNLFASGLLYNVRVSKENTSAGTKVTYVVQCNPEVVEIQFKGNKVFTDAQLRKRISSKIGDHPGERKLFLDAQEIQNEYERAGYAGVKVKYSTVLDEASCKAKVTFEVVEPR